MCSSLGGGGNAKRVAEGNQAITRGTNDLTVPLPVVPTGTYVVEVDRYRPVGIPLSLCMQKLCVYM